jgi:hypothetical protein
VNGRIGDPALYLETQFERRAILFDLGDLSNLPTLSGLSMFLFRTLTSTISLGSIAY